MSTGAGIISLDPFGIEVRTCNWAENKQALRTLFKRHGLLVLREQHFTMDQQVDLLSCFGPVLETWSGKSYVSNVREDGALGNVELGFHSDYMWHEHGYRAISLHAIDVVNGKTSTRYASTMRALEMMPCELRQRIDAMNVVNVMPQNYGSLLTAPSLDNYPADAPRFVHPIVKDDIVTGRPSSTVNAMMSAEIVGLASEDSRALLDEIQKFLYEPTNIYEHRWNTGDVVIWSNGAIHHARGAIDPESPRTLQRVCLATAAEVGAADDLIKAREVKLSPDDGWKAAAAGAVSSNRQVDVPDAPAR